MADEEQEMSLRQARAQFAAVVNEASARGTMIWLTNRGRRVAAIVSLTDGETIRIHRKSHQHSNTTR